MPRKPSLFVRLWTLTQAPPGPKATRLHPVDAPLTITSDDALFRPWAVHVNLRGATGYLQHLLDEFPQAVCSHNHQTFPPAINMQDPTLPGNLHSSPKRKRSDYSLNTPPPTSRLKISTLPPNATEEDDLEGGRSPRTAVAGHLQSLDIQDKKPMPLVDFRRALDGQSSHVKGNGSLSNGSADLAFSLDPDGGPARGVAFCSGPSAHRPLTPPTDSNTMLEIPETPRLKPVSSPLPSPGSKSPPGLWWSDAEITGHDPKDPSDDGYGINGVGFIPTPAVATARAERRKKQVAEWKNREAKEARQKRSDRRRRRDQWNEGSGAGTSGGQEGRKVRFLES